MWIQGRYKISLQHEEINEYEIVTACLSLEDM
jgi:hypothetical protein